MTAINYMYEKPKRSITMMMIKMIMIIILIAIVICISSTGRVVRAAMSNKLMMAGTGSKLFTADIGGGAGGGMASIRLNFQHCEFPAISLDSH